MKLTLKLPTLTTPSLNNFNLRKNKKSKRNFRKITREERVGNKNLIQIPAGKEKDGYVIYSYTGDGEVPEKIENVQENTTSYAKFLPKRSENKTIALHPSTFTQVKRFALLCEKMFHHTDVKLEIEMDNQRMRLLRVWYKNDAESSTKTYILFKIIDCKILSDEVNEVTQIVSDEEEYLPMLQALTSGNSTSVSEKKNPFVGKTLITLKKDSKYGYVHVFFHLWKYGADLQVTRTGPVLCLKEIKRSEV